MHKGINTTCDEGQTLVAYRNHTVDLADTLSVGANQTTGFQSEVDATTTVFRKSKRAQSVTDDESWVEAETANTINAFDTGERDTHAVAFQGGSQQDQVIGLADVCPALAHSSNANCGHYQPKYLSIDHTVRRLTPRECERLQGFPDDWTLIPWRGRSAEDCPDGPRYRALGNSMAVNCMEWIGQRIADYEARVSAPADEVST